MLTTLFVFVTLFGLTEFLFNNKGKSEMNQFCYAECVEGKHYKDNTNFFYFQ